MTTKEVVKYDSDGFSVSDLRKTFAVGDKVAVKPKYGHMTKCKIVSLDLHIHQSEFDHGKSKLVWVIKPTTKPYATRNVGVLVEELLTGRQMVVKAKEILGDWTEAKAAAEKRAAQVAEQEAATKARHAQREALLPKVREALAAHDFKSGDVYMSDYDAINKGRCSITLTALATLLGVEVEEVQV